MVLVRSLKKIFCNLTLTCGLYYLKHAQEVVRKVHTHLGVEQSYLYKWCQLIQPKIVFDTTQGQKHKNNNIIFIVLVTCSASPWRHKALKSQMGDKRAPLLQHTLHPPPTTTTYYQFTTVSLFVMYPGLEICTGNNQIEHNWKEERTEVHTDG